jgi:NAD(P)-dependent dehydrogenase (short-subunit alcohol dehydrogenase family)
MQLKDKVVIITGAGSGVGRASALLFAAEGARVVCADLQAAWADDTVALVAAAGGTATAVRCDVSNEEDVTAMVEAAVASFGRLDVVFNNAGISTPRPGMLLEDHTMADFERLIGVNLRSVFLGCRAAVIQFKKQGDGGVIVNTASAAGMVGWGGSVYGTTKGGVIQLTRAVAIECASHNIRCNAICPAAMPFTNFMAPDATTGSVGVSADLAQQLGAVHPLGRPITAEDCAAAALFLASDAARNITGILLPVDGGYTAR